MPYLIIIDDYRCPKCSYRMLSLYTAPLANGLTFIDWLLRSIKSHRVTRCYMVKKVLCALLGKCKFPKDHWTLKTGYFENPTPAIQVQNLPLEGPRSLGFYIFVPFSSTHRYLHLWLKGTTIFFWVRIFVVKPWREKNNKKNQPWAGI